MKSKELSLTKQRLKYVVSDLVTTSIAFLLFDICRFFILHDEIPSSQSLNDYLSSPKLILEQIFIPIALLFIYWLSGYYNHPCEKSRLQEFITTFYSALFNATLIFFLGRLSSDKRIILSSIGIHLHRAIDNNLRNTALCPATQYPVQCPDNWKFPSRS